MISVIMYTRLNVLNDEAMTKPREMTYNLIHKLTQWLIYKTCTEDEITQTWPGLNRLNFNFIQTCYSEIEIFPLFVAKSLF